MLLFKRIARPEVMRRWKYKEGDFDSTLTIEQALSHTSEQTCRLNMGHIPLQQLTKILT